MKKVYLIWLVFLVLLLLVGSLLIFPNKTDDVFVVNAQDGAAELRIPKDALLMGGTIADITMTAIGSSDSTKMYRLEPDGLTFSKPVALSVTLPYNKNKAYAPVLLTFSGEERKTEILDIKNFLIDEERGTVTVFGEVSHFSDLLFIDRYIFDIEHFPKNTITAVLGQSFEITHVTTPEKIEQLSKVVVDPVTREAKYRVTTRDVENEYRPEDRNYTIVATEIQGGTKWKIPEGTGTIYTNGVVEPGKVDLAEAELDAAQEYRVTTRFTCVKLGRDRLSFRARPLYSPEPTITHVKGGKLGEPVVMFGGGGRVGVVELMGPEINCVTPPSDTASANANTGNSTAETPLAPTPKSSGGVIKVCGLPGGEPCPKR